MRHRDSAGSNEVLGCPKRCLSNVGHEVIAEISSISQVENLKNRLKVGALTNLEVLRYAGIKLEERLTPQIVKWCESALAGTQTVSVFHPVRI